MEGNSVTGPANIGEKLAVHSHLMPSICLIYIFTFYLEPSYYQYST